MSFRNVTDTGRGEEFALSNRAYPMSERQETAGEWRVWANAKNRKVYTNGIDLLIFFIYSETHRQSTL
ncbi:hypothetical protein D4L85_28705 [Chryseolinea soli]|uniref:Uncharacterized protein n=1 Tax=Chryseolinea soli TaxID=2321403 RepID=A0A385STR7_9BACT|nr:hypothetical protein D4L85_28705 [Chryseolinea soli]